MIESIRKREEKVVKAHRYFSGAFDSMVKNGRTREGLLFRRPVGENGLCKGCEKLNIHIGRKGVALTCDAGVSIPDLYTNTPLGQKAECDKFIPLQDIK